MIIGVPKEIKNHEYRVGLTPGSAAELIHHGHEVIVETKAGDGIGFSDKEYTQVGAKIASTAKEVFDNAQMIVKVKEPQPNECRMLREDQLLFTYLHLAPDPLQTDLLLESGCTAIAYETVTDAKGRLPLLTPMSEVAGRLSIQAGAHCLEKAQGGSGVLLGGVPGVKSAKVVVIGGGVVGLNAIRMAIGMEAHVTVLDRSLDRLRELDDYFGPKLNCIYATKDSVQKYVQEADLVVGAVLVPGAQAPKLVTKEMIKSMKKGSVVVDVAIDQGGCFETSKATTHAEPTYIVDEVVHYCVANMPGAVARTSTEALNNATLPFALALANKGYKKALNDDVHLKNGLSVHKGMLTSEPVAVALGLQYTSADEALDLGSSTAALA
ncbi:alanine dehydrogenase [Fangia hongkongensis]|uniref:alanine dehydrogenase n=1 Tax=Fangia hongkongensis TaxID=270495 RepID=UPI0003707E83|nr:alanine dehydrogenase [Fangia hongkongensis]MBK2124397.1 alanine dehydrogenase [Fangia hongkongensis]